MDQPLNLVECVGLDDVLYAIRPMVWTVDRLDEAWERWRKCHILSDDLPETVVAFAYFVTNNGAVWFEVIKGETQEQVGLVYVNDFKMSLVSGRYNQALFHAVMWDAKVGVRRALGRLFLKYLFQVFGFHRLQAEIPLKFGGAIRTMKKLGFQVEGTLRASKRYNGIWYNVAVLGLLENEVGNE